MLYRIWGNKLFSSKTVTKLQCAGTYSVSSDGTAVGLLRVSGVNNTCGVSVNRYWW